MNLIKKGLKDVKVSGRSEIVPNSKGLTIMIDFAHSPKSLENILSSVKYYCKGRLITVFGCGGNRDKGKREVMGEIAGKLSDFTIITSDNPRNEDPSEIIYEIEKGILTTDGKYICIVNRIEAIKYAIDIADENDIIILARKRS